MTRPLLAARPSDYSKLAAMLCTANAAVEPCIVDGLRLATESDHTWAMLLWKEESAKDARRWGAVKTAGVWPSPDAARR